MRRFAPWSETHTVDAVGPDAAGVVVGASEGVLGEQFAALEVVGEEASLRPSSTHIVSSSDQMPRASRFSRGNSNSRSSRRSPVARS